jgi:hypothetical protein
VALALASSFVFGYSTAHADSTVDIVNALVSKGVLTEEEGALLIKGHDGEVDGVQKKEKKAWSNKISIRGYIQTRNTHLLDGDDVGVNLHSDRSVGNDSSLSDQDKNFLIRRARVVISGDVGDRLGIYIQPDFASTPAGAGQVSGNFAQLRDFYGDLYLTKNKVHRIRVGQSKVPYGFENLQSSQNRLGLDRADALNSAVKDERDLGAFYYYTPETTQALFKEITDLGLKHSGNYGQFALGAYNGQGANNRERNDNYHIVARYTHPWKTESGQIYEAGIQGYSGNYVPVTTGTYRRRNPTTGVVATTAAAPTIANVDAKGINDERVALSFMMYPQPFGLQGEWTWGNTPGLDISKGANGTIEEQNLNGGYVQAMYKIDNFKVFDTNGILIPFVRWQYFDGYQKAESNAAPNKVNDWEIGAEWQIAPEVEFVAYYHHMKRTNLVVGASAANAALGGPATDYEVFEAGALRMQLQFNY